MSNVNGCLSFSFYNKADKYRKEFLKEDSGKNNIRSEKLVMQLNVLYVSCTLGWTLQHMLIPALQAI